MSILFADVYIKAIGLFDDPKITTAYETNIVQFDKIMYTYLQNSIAQFSSPSEIAYRLSNYNPPKGTIETFVSDGVTRTYRLDENFIVLDNSEYVYTEGELIASGKIERNTEEVLIEGSETGETKEIVYYTVTFDDLIPQGQEYSIEQYYVGEFLDGFVGIINGLGGDEYVRQRTINILARLLVESWAENQRNFLLDIKNTMSDTDFKLTSNSPILKSKIAWVNQLNDEIREYRNSLDWKIRANKMMNNNY